LTVAMSTAAKAPRLGAHLGDVAALLEPLEELVSVVFGDGHRSSS